MPLHKTLGETFGTLKGTSKKKTKDANQEKGQFICFYTRAVINGQIYLHMHTSKSI